MSTDVPVCRRHRETVVAFTSKSDPERGFVSLIDRHKAELAEQTPFEGSDVLPNFNGLVVLRTRCPVVYYDTKYRALLWLHALLSCTPDDINWEVVAVPRSNLRTFTVS